MKKALIYFLVAIMLLSVCSCKVKTQGDEEIAQAVTEQVTEGSSNSLNNADDAQETEQEQKNDKTIAQNSLSDATQKHSEILFEQDIKIDDSAATSTKVFSYNEKEANLTFKEKVQVCKSWFQYNYTDDVGNIYMFYENDGFVGFRSSLEPDKSAPEITQQQALQIAKDYAKEVFVNDFDNYVLCIEKEMTPIMTPIYFFSFSKQYGKDNCLNGESCVIQVYKTGEIKECWIRDLYAFKALDTDKVNNISKEDINKIVYEQLKTTYENIEEWNYTVDSSNIQCSAGDWVIYVTVSLENTETGAISATDYFLEIN